MHTFEDITMVRTERTDRQAHNGKRKKGTRNKENVL